jgi:hypothetical protein
MKRQKKHAGVMNIGTSSMIVILIGLSFAVLAALAISSARNDYRLSKELADHTRSYYDASSEATRRLASSDALYEERDESDRVSFTVDAGGEQELAVTVHFTGGADSYDIEQWQMVNTSDWVGDESLPGLFMGN